MMRTQVQLTEQQYRQLRRVAQDEGVSIAEVVRRCVNRSLSEPDRAELYARAATLAGRFRTRNRLTDLAENHDRYIDETRG